MCTDHLVSYRLPLLSTTTRARRPVIAYCSIRCIAFFSLLTMTSLTSAVNALSVDALSLDQVRALATRFERDLLAHDEARKLISFKGDFHEADGKHPKGSYDRIDVWYGTGTVATVVDHPNIGRNQMFRGKNAPQTGARPITIEDLELIFKNLRVHTDVGYRKKGKKPAERSASEDDSDGSWQDLGGDLVGKLSKRNLAKLDKSLATRRQFNCPEHGSWWRKCAPSKAVSKCSECGIKFDAIPEEEERGRGHYECTECGNVWTSNTACRGLAQYCQVESCTLRDKQVGAFPKIVGKQLARWQLQLKKRAWEKKLADPNIQSSRRVSLGSRTHSLPTRPSEPSSGGGLGTFSASNGGNYRDANDGGGEYRTADSVPEPFNDASSTSSESRKSRPKPTPRKHWCTGCASGRCKAAPPHSKAHVSTGSTATSMSGVTWSSRASTTGSLGSFQSSEKV